MPALSIARAKTISIRNKMVREYFKLYKYKLSKVDKPRPIIRRHLRKK
mgnify:CR=1 FL=1